MREEILQTPFVTHYFTKENNFLEQIWTNQEDMETDDFKSNMLAYAELYQKYDVQYVFVDSRLMSYPVTPEVQDWINENILPKIMPYLKKLGFLLSDDIFEEMSIRQAIGDSEFEEQIVRYFKDEEEVRNWLG